MSNTSKTVFDFVIIGGGTTGLVLASRLSEDTNISICILEAGHNLAHTPEMNVPGLQFANTSLDDRMWRFNTTPQTHIKDRIVAYPRGKTLGGTSAVNYLLITRAQAEDYDALEQLGNPGWNWKNLLEYAKKGSTETFTVSPDQAKEYCLKVDTKYHGTTGPIHRSPPFWTSNLDTIFFKGLEAVGVPRNPDPFNGDLSGAFVANHAIDPRTVTRSSSVSGYYEPIKDRPNLCVFEDSQVTRIILEKDNNGGFVAKGVEYQDIVKNSRKTVFAKREVLLCAGVIQTPQLLELSGIGDGNVLKSHGIDALIDLPGDHNWSSYNVEVVPESETKDFLLDPAIAQKELELYQEKKRGMFTTGGSSAFAFLSLPDFMGKERIDELVAKVDINNPDGHSTTLAIQKDWLSSRVPHFEIASIPAYLPSTGEMGKPGKRYLSFLIGLQHMLGRGTIHITSADPFAPPAVNPNVLKEEVDLEILVDSFKFIRHLISTPAYKDVVVEEVLPGPNVKTDEELKEYIRNTVNTIYHPIGTAAMLPRKDGGVVDSQLKVYETNNLRVVRELSCGEHSSPTVLKLDASIFPLHITGHPTQTLHAMAERLADIIKGNVA
ncbi:hypothetical protein VNI00_004144 [Paramarasmius palmivorus]|uniref:Alcohol oxidase n=1 Tax=Paramarasmius palmivorus TaxID=297713 RepID=A0AAW0DPX9_9AGAR